MQQLKETEKRKSDATVRTISQQFDSVKPDKSNCKCDNDKELDQLKEVHLVSSRRQIFEETPKLRENLTRNSSQYQKGGKRQSGRSKLNYDFNNVEEKPNEEKKLENDHQNSDDHNNNVFKFVQDDQEKVENYRNFVINSIIDDFKGENLGTDGDPDGDENETAKSIEKCEEVINEMMKNETRKSLKSLALSLSFIQSLLGTDNKQPDFEDKFEEPPSNLLTEVTKETNASREIEENCERKNFEENATQSRINPPVLINIEDKSDFYVPEDEMANIDDGQDDDNKMRKPRLSRFNRLSLKKQKYKPATKTLDQTEDDDDIFGSMVDDNDYCLEVINAWNGVVLNKISLQRTCISNVLINTTESSEDSHKINTNGSTRASSEDLHSNGTLLEDINVTTTVYYDENSNPRIEKVIDENKLHVAALSEENLAPPPSPTLPRRRQSLIIKELLNTEVTFLEGLRIAIDEYMAYFENHPDLRYSNRDYLRALFGNIEKMYAESQKFHADLLTCDDNIERVASTFLEHKNLFEVFVEYIKNKPTAHLFSLGLYQNVIKERHAQLVEKDFLDLDSYLLTPIQRLGRYILFMENLQKVANATGEICTVLNETIQFLKKEMRRADTFVAAVSIGNSLVDLTKKGSLVAKETFNIKRKYKSVVFLFEEVVVFTIPNNQRSESYFYKYSIDMSDLTIRSDQEQPLTFNLRSFSKSRNYEDSPHSFELEAPSEKIKKKWVQEIENLLWQQLQKCKAEALSGEIFVRKFNKAPSSNSSSHNYKKKKQLDAPPTPSAIHQRQSVFYVEC